jgi:sec-independent protein translocase protein TatC
MVVDEFHNPDNDRPSFYGEVDHSQTEFDLDAEIEAKLGKAPDEDEPAPAPARPESGLSSSARAVDVDEFHDPDDERPSFYGEDDYSQTEFDLDAEIAAKLGPADAAPASAAASPAPEGGDAAAMHPDLAASFAAAQAFAAREHGDESDDASDAEFSYEEPAIERQPDANDDAEEPDQDDNGPSEPDPSPDDDDSAGLPATPEPDAVAGAGATPPDGTGGDTDEEDKDDKPMSLRDHFRELRKRVLRAFLWMLGGFIICYPFGQQLFTLLMEPLLRVMPPSSKLIFTNPPEAFFTFLKVSFVGGIFLTSPMVFYQLWAFVAPGLYKEEKQHILPVAFFSAIFFIAGGAFCYFIGFPFIFEFFMSYNQGPIQAMPALSETLSFVLQLLLAFGLVFELPLFVFFLSRLGIVTADMMRRFRRYAILVNVIVAAILTPPDVMSQMLMAGPLIILYEASILIAAVFGKKKPKPEPEADEEEDDEEYEDDEEEDDVQDAVKKY